MRRLLPFLLVVSWSLPAAATPNFPFALRDQLSLDYAPPCVTCHEGATAIGTVVTPFGTSMRARGLLAYDEGTLAAALAAMTADAVDSDTDGATDIDELIAGTNPNGPDDELLPEPVYGCGGAHLVAATPASRWPRWAALAALLLLGLALRRRTRRP